jgi:hypothetical protein
MAGLLLPVGIAPLENSFGLSKETTTGGAGASPNMSCVRKRGVITGEIFYLFHCWFLKYVSCHARVSV